MNLLLVIDLQKSFINENTEHILEKINNLLDKNEYDKVLFTRFINTEDGIYYKKLNYDGCITEEDKCILVDTKNNQVIDKTIYSALNDEFKDYLKENNIKKIYLCGLDTECCILKNALDLFESEYDVYVLSEYCACMNGIERHNNALEILRRTIGVNSII